MRLRNYIPSGALVIVTHVPRFMIREIIGITNLSSLPLHSSEILLAFLVTKNRLSSLLYYSEGYC